MKVGKPHGPADMDCPDWQKPMSEVCHKCPLWLDFQVKQPGSPTFAVEWDCAKVWSPKLQHAAIQSIDHSAAEQHEFRNELAKVAEREHKIMAAGVLTRFAEVQIAAQEAQAPLALQHDSRIDN